MIRSLRTRLFLYMGSILLLIAILSYLITQFFIRKDLSQAAVHLNQYIETSQERMQKTIDSWLAYRYLQTMAQLNAVAQSVPRGQKNNWEYAASIISFAPDVAFVQVTDPEERTALVSPQTGKSYLPAWAKDPTGKIWIKIEDDQFFATSPLGEGIYLLLPSTEEKVKKMAYTAFEPESTPLSKSDSRERIFEILKAKDLSQMEKAQLIQILVSHLGQVSGIVKIDSHFKQAKLLLSQDIFSDKPLVSLQKKSVQPFILVREKEKEKEIDQVQVVFSSQPFLAIGFSISQQMQTIAQLIERPVVLSEGGQIFQAFDTQGRMIPPEQISTTGQTIKWEGSYYIPSHIHITDTTTISILTPESIFSTINRMLHQLRANLLAKISLNLLIITLLLFLLALFLLARISKRITRPIAMLAHAAEEIGNGKHEGLKLPKSNHRQDEVAVLAHSFEKMVISLKERETIRGILNKVVSKEIASKVLSGDIELGGEERVLTILFSDIRGFTPLSEKLDPPSLISLLNSYMTRMCRIIDESHGVVDKFVGDEIMALYGAPLELPDHSEKALEAAIAMIKSLKEWNQEGGHLTLTVGIGIHMGLVSAGNMGAENRLNYTVIGANVNLASRLCSAALPMQILISEESHQALTHPENYSFQKLPPMQLKGIDQPITVYALSP